MLRLKRSKCSKINRFPFASQPKIEIEIKNPSKYLEIANPSKYLEIALLGRMSTSKYRDVLKDSLTSIIRFELTEEAFQPVRKHYTS